MFYIELSSYCPTTPGSERNIWTGDKPTATVMPDMRLNQPDMMEY